MSRVIDIDLFLKPRSIAIVGFSTRTGSPGQACLAGLVANGFEGDIHLVGRGAGEFEGRAVLDRVEALPEGVELALLLVPAVAVRAAVAGLVARRARAGVIFASGFAEMGEAARREQEAIEQMAAEAGLPLVGPNCMGYTNFVNRLSIGFMPARPLPEWTAQGRPAVALVTQSGGLMAHFWMALDSRRIPVAYRISTGNEVGVQISDFIAHLADDPSLRVISCYAEHLRDAGRFLAAVRKARAAGKEIVLMHPGRTERARKAAASHTGALAGDWAVMAAAVTGAGVLLVDTMDELIDVTELLLRFPAPTQGVAVLTTSGALCAHANDCCEALRLPVPAFSPDVMAALKARMPDFVDLGNPFDLTTQVVWDPELIGDCAALALSDPAIGSVLAIVPLGNPKMAEGVRRRVVTLAAEARKPLVLSIMGDDSPIPDDYLDAMRGAGVPFIRSGERALRALAKVTEHGIRAAARPASPAVAGGAAAAGARLLTAGAWAEWEAKNLLREAGIAVPEGGLGTTADEAVHVAGQVGWPVALKLQSRQILHKTEVGGVRLNLADESALREAWSQLAQRAAAVQGARLDGMLVERMSPPGVEMLVGARRDPGWGPMLMVGLGGIAVEVLEDVRLLTLPAAPEDIAEEMLRLKAARLLGPFRGAPARDVAAAARMAAALGELMLAHPEIAEIDLNPVMVMAQGSGALALDGLIVVSDRRG